MNNVFSFLDVVAAIAGPGGAFGLGSGSANSEEGITINSNGDIGGMQIGADGEGQHSLYGDKSGTVTISLLKTSPVNQQLMDLYNFQTATSAAYGRNTIVITDSVRGDVITCEQCGFKKPPDLTFAKDAGMNTWEFNAIKINRVLGGA